MRPASPHPTRDAVCTQCQSAGTRSPQTSDAEEKRQARFGGWGVVNVHNGVCLRVPMYELRQEKIRATYWITGNKAYLNSDAGSDVLNRKSTLDLVWLHPSLALNRCVARMLHAHP